MQPGSNPDIQDEDEFDIDDLIDGNFSRDRSHPIRHTKDMRAADSNLLTAQITTPDKASSGIWHFLTFSNKISWFERSQGKRQSCSR